MHILLLEIFREYAILVTHLWASKLHIRTTLVSSFQGMEVWKLQRGARNGQFGQKGLNMLTCWLWMKCASDPTSLKAQNWSEVHCMQLQNQVWLCSNNGLDLAYWSDDSGPHRLPVLTLSADPECWCCYSPEFSPSGQKMPGKVSAAPVLHHWRSKCY